VKNAPQARRAVGAAERQARSVEPLSKRSRSPEGRVTNHWPEKQSFEATAPSTGQMLYPASTALGGPHQERDRDPRQVDLARRLSAARCVRSALPVPPEKRRHRLGHDLQHMVGHAHRARDSSSTRGGPISRSRGERPGRSPKSGTEIAWATCDLRHGEAPAKAPTPSFPLLQRSRMSYVTRSALLQIRNID
jgi:hypothetical protein